MLANLHSIRFRKDSWSQQGEWLVKFSERHPYRPGLRRSVGTWDVCLFIPVTSRKPPVSDSNRVRAASALDMQDKNYLTSWHTPQVNDLPRRSGLCRSATANYAVLQSVVVQTYTYRLLCTLHMVGSGGVPVHDRTKDWQPGAPSRSKTRLDNMHCIVY